MPRAFVREAVARTLRRIDAYLAGETLRDLPPPDLRHAADALIGQSASVRTAGLFLASYSVVDPDYDFASVPRGWRGTSGDKLLCEGLRERSLALGDVKAFAENIGAKGAQSDFDPSIDARFAPFAPQMSRADPADRARVAEYLASRYADSQQVLPTLPAVGDDVLTFDRAKALFHGVLDSASGGALQQFLVAGLLREARKGTGIDVVTHNPYGSDRSDRTAGDVEERVGNVVLRAYEVTATLPWRDRLSAAQRKMDRHGLAKYVVLGRGVNGASEWSEPAQLGLQLRPHSRDIAVVDLEDVVNWMAAQLSASQIRSVLRDVEAMVRSPALCGRHDVAQLYADLVGRWLDGA